VENALVVECKKCGTRFQLDTARIPDDGIRVRCSRCKNAFFLQHPSQSQVNAVEAVVEGTIAEGGMATPSSTQDLPIASQPDAAATSVDSADADADAEDEDDWEFNQELPEFDDDDSDEDDFAEGVDTDDGLSADYNQASHDVGSIDLEHDRSFTTDPEEVYSNTSGADVAAAAQAVEADPLEMTSNDLVASSMSIESPPAPAPAQAQQPEPGIAGARKEAFGSPDDFSNLMEPEALPPVASPDEVSENPEDWDFFGDADTSSPSGGTPAGPSSSTRTAPKAAKAVGRKPSGEAQVPGDWKGLEGDKPVSGIAGVATALAWVVFYALVAAGVYFGVAESFDRSVSAPAFVSVGEMRAANIRGQFLETARAGTLYVITGDLLNPGNVARALNHAVYVHLLGEDGHVLDSPPAIAGRDVELDRLREMTVDELQASQRIASRSLAFQKIEPGQAASFAAAFVGLPERASHFQIRAVESESTAD
jgi:predicted Zn finger-like uncharacterized protein